MPPRIRAIDGLRTVAMLAVFLTHLVAAAAPWLPNTHVGARLVELVRVTSGLGSSAFFVLAGFFASRTLLAKRVPAGEFLRKRAWRLYPGYAAVLAAYLVAALISPEWSKLPAGAGQAFRSAALNALVFPLAFGAEPILVVSWTLGVIAAMYLLFAALVFAARVCGAPDQAVHGLLLGIAFTLPGLGLQQGGVLFACGAALEVACRGRRYNPAWCLTLSGVALACRVLHVYGIGLDSRIYYHLVEASVSGGLLLALASRPSMPWGVLSNPVCVWMAGLSYSFYLVHGAVLRVLKVSLFPVLDRYASPAFPLLAFFAGLACALAAALALNQLVERRRKVQAERVSECSRAWRQAPERPSSSATARFGSPLPSGSRVSSHS